MTEQEEKWVPVSFVKAITNWGNRELRRARESKLIEFKKYKDSKGRGHIRYNLNSLPPEFIKRQSLAT